MTEIATILRQRVQQEQTISFARFMELALYCPNLGYYEQEEGRIGSAGDFYTSVSAGRLFGQLLARQFCTWLAEWPQPVQLVEAGAHDGRLASDILGWIRDQRRDVFDRLQYCLVEPSQRRRAWQRARLADFAGHISWVGSIEELGPVCANPTPGLRDLPSQGTAGWSGPALGVLGVIFSNELLDAFPVHRLVWDAHKKLWTELGVGWGEGGFLWRRMEAERAWEPSLREAGIEVPAELAAIWPDGFTLDWSPLAGEWWRQAARVLRAGKLMTIDYGLTSSELLAPHRCGGTLRAYRDHRMTSDLLAAPGQQDLTAHVDFTQLRLAGEREQLQTQELISQERFLTRIAEEKWRQSVPTAAELRQFRTLTHPEHLGRAFRALIQSRGQAPPGTG